MVIADHWGSITREVLQAREGKMSFNAYNKSLAVGRALVALTDEYLKRRQCV